MILNNLTSLRSFTDESGICCSSGQVDLFSDPFFWFVCVYQLRFAPADLTVCSRLLNYRHLVNEMIYLSSVQS